MGKIYTCTKCGTPATSVPPGQTSDVTTNPGHHVLPGDPEDWICHGEFVEDETPEAKDVGEKFDRQGMRAVEALRPKRELLASLGVADTEERERRILERAAERVAEGKE